ncbi:MAG: PspC domain-containing protein [Acidimicrobiales bacterium]
MTLDVPARPRWQLPRIDSRERWVGGVAAAVAREIGVQPLVIRAAFAILALAGGWGLLFYGLAWIVLAVAQPDRLAPYQPEPKAASPIHRHIAVGMIVVGLLSVFSQIGFAFFPKIVVPAGFILTGILIAWTRSQDESGVAATARTVIGVVVGLGGLIAFVLVSDSFVNSLVVVLVAIVIAAGVGLVAFPSLARIGRELDAERQDRVRADERARVAAHLHDSVLQTLALIQRHADDPARTSQLARQQERELRQWLYGTPATLATRLGPALEAMAAEVDAAHGVPVTVITVGDTTDVDQRRIEPLVAAAREAAVNAAKHSGAPRIDVFAERLPNRIEVFVRDTGRGFDPDGVPPDRRGLADSIRARMQRAGGSATVQSAPGAGTEVELVLPLLVDTVEPQQEVSS